MYSTMTHFQWLCCEALGDAPRARSAAHPYVNVTIRSLFEFSQSFQIYDGWTQGVRQPLR